MEVTTKENLMFDVSYLRYKETESHLLSDISLRICPKS